jgi:hypothetical protein
MHGKAASRTAVLPLILSLRSDIESLPSALIMIGEGSLLGALT